MKRLLYILLLAGILMSCGSDDEGYIDNDDAQYESVDDNSEGENVQEDNKNKAYRLGKVTMTAEGKTLTIENYGIDPYTVMNWFTGKDGATPMAGVVFKSSDFESTLLVNMKDFDTSKDEYKGKMEIENSQPTASFGQDGVTYMFTSGTMEIDEFSRKTGKVKIRLEGKCNKTVMFEPTQMKTDVPATLEIDAYMPLYVLDGVAGKTEAASNYSL